MNRFVVATGSITHALKGKEILVRNNYNAAIERMKYGTEKYGCGYGIIAFGNTATARQLLASGNVKVYEIKNI